MQIVLIGLNHKTASIEVRERLAFLPHEVKSALKEIRGSSWISEVILLSTCNRVEFLLTTQNVSGAIDTVKSFLAGYKDTPVEVFEKALYVFQGDDAVRHIFRVASSLDSMVVGEPQILGQIKSAYREAVELRTSGPILNRLLHKTFSVAKQVRRETGIGDGAVSVSYAAVELARKIFGELKGKAILLIGAGEMAELAVDHLRRCGAKSISVANRTFEKGVALAQRFNGKAISMAEISEHLAHVDIVISSTGAGHYILVRDHLKGLMRRRKNRPIFFIDIAVPRDIDPEINRVSNIYVYDIDDLKGVIEENLNEREKEALKGERIIETATIRFRSWLLSLDVVPTIVAIRQKLEDIRQAELKKTFSTLKTASPEDRKAIERLTISMINKIMHDPILFLKDCEHKENVRSLYIDVSRKLFNLDETQE